MARIQASITRSEIEAYLEGLTAVVIDARICPSIHKDGDGQSGADNIRIWKSAYPGLS